MTEQVSRKEIGIKEIDECINILSDLKEQDMHKRSYHSINKSAIKRARLEINRRLAKCEGLNLWG